MHDSVFNAVSNHNGNTMSIKRKECVCVWIFLSFFFFGILSFNFSVVVVLTIHGDEWSLTLSFDFATLCGVSMWLYVTIHTQRIISYCGPVVVFNSLIFFGFLFSLGLRHIRYYYYDHHVVTTATADDYNLFIYFNYTNFVDYRFCCIHFHGMSVCTVHRRLLLPEYCERRRIHDKLFPCFAIVLLRRGFFWTKPENARAKSGKFAKRDPSQK